MARLRNPQRPPPAEQTTRQRRSARAAPSTPPNKEFAADDLAAASKFARSVGGIEKAQALLAQLKSAKDVAPLHRDGL